MGVTVLVIGIVVAVVVASRIETGHHRRRAIRKSTIASVALLGASFTWLAALTPVGEGTGRYLDMSPMGSFHADNPLALSHLTGNLLLLTWVGLCLPALLPSLTWKRTVGAVAALSIAIEVAQYAVAMGRVASIQDFILNVTGGAIAALIGVWVVRPWVEGRRAHDLTVTREQPASDSRQNL
jgi:hypothetical protein